MSIIIHRCTCGHTPTRHISSGWATALEECRNGIAGCACNKYEAGEQPELLPTWTPTGTPITEITAPGGKVDGRRMCDCPLCTALFAELGGVVIEAP